MPYSILAVVFIALGLCVGAAFGETKSVPLMPNDDPTTADETGVVPVENEPTAISGTAAVKPVAASTPIPAPEIDEVAVILSNNRFFPSRIRVKAGRPVRFVFATVNRKPAALVIEQLQAQRWLTAETTETPSKAPELNREVSCQKATEIVMEPKAGTYRFSDPVSGATGDLIAE